MHARVGEAVAAETIILADITEEVEGEEVIADVAGVEEQISSVVRLGSLRGFLGDFRVLDHLEVIAHLADDAHGFIRESLLHNLKATHSSEEARQTVECTLAAQSAFFSRQYPTKTGSATRTRMLSTQ